MFSPKVGGIDHGVATSKEMEIIIPSPAPPEAKLSGIARMLAGLSGSFNCERNH